MKQVKCINPKNFKLTSNSNYIVLAEENNFYSLTNDSGKIVKYSTTLFEDVEVVIQAPVVPPVVIVIPRTEQDCINSIEINVTHPVNTELFVITTKYIDLENNLIDFSTTVQIRNSLISCGIYQCSGLNDICQNILNNVNTSNNDLDLLIKSLFKQTIIKFFDYYDEECAHFRFMLLSTNSNNNYEDFFTYLTEMSDVTTEWKENPNSGNFIKTWIIDYDVIDE